MFSKASTEVFFSCYDVLMPKRTAQPKLIAIGGLPGSGKTTLSKRIAEKNGYIRLCPDEWMADMELSLKDSRQRQRIELLMMDFAGQLLFSQKSVIVELPLWKRAERTSLKKFATDHNALLELHFLDAPTEILLKRLQIRDTENQASYGKVSEAELLMWSSEVEKPTRAELAHLNGNREIMQYVI